MNPFQTAILDLKAQSCRTAEIEARFPSDGLSLRICGLDSDACINTAAGMAVDEFDEIRPNFGMVTSSDPNEITVIAYRGNAMVGQATVCLYATSTGKWPEEHEIWFKGVYVAADCRREGGGTALTDACGEILKAIMTKAMEVDPCSWEYIDPHPGADTTHLSRQLLARLAKDFGAFNDELCERMCEIEDVTQNRF